MSNPFVGLNVQVKLKHPPSTLHGHVASVRGQQLLLSNVVFLKTGKRLQEYNVHGAEIEDIEVLSQQNGDSPAPPSTETRVLQTGQSSQPVPQQKPQATPSAVAKIPIGPFRPAQLPPTTNTSYQDPAILSFQRTPVKDHVAPVPHKRSNPPTSAPQASAATLTAPFTTLELNGNGKGLDEAQPLDGDVGHNFSNASTQGGEAERLQRRKSKQSTVLNGVASSPRFVKEASTSDGHSQSGWRQTPILQPQVAPSSPNPTRAARGSKGGAAKDNTTSARQPTGRRKRALDKEASKNGWGTEDATDVKDMPDFDFEDNLSKFDKKAVWAELRAGDTTADEDRLVSFNRVKSSAPGTFGGQKLHPTENVLGGSRKVSLEFDETESELDLAASGSSRKMLRSLSRGSRRAPSRKDSLRTEVQATAPSMASRTISRRTPAEQAGLSPQISGYMASPPSSSFSTSAPQAAAPTKTHLRYLASNRPCRTVTPDTLQAIETLAKNGFGMTDDILNENAGRSIAELVLSTIDPSGQRLSASNHNAPPVVVMLVGETKVGTRALAAARHLLERNVRVIAGLSGAVDLENGILSAQIQRLRGKVVRSWSETKAHLSTLDAPPEMIVDGMVGIEDLTGTPGMQHYDTMIDMMSWVRSSKAPVLSIDFPSEVYTWDGMEPNSWPHNIKSKIIIACGVPLTNLIESWAHRRDSSPARLFVADIGLNPAARPFMKMRTQDEDDAQKGHFIQFGSEWVVAVRLEGGLESTQ